MDEGLFFSCGCSDDERGGLYLCREDGNGGFRTVSVTPLKGANYVCYSPDGKSLYATWNEGRTGGVAAYRLGTDGSLAFLNKAASDGAAACHLTASPDGGFLYAVNYAAGNFAEFKLAADSSIEARTRVVSHSAYPVGPRADRQEKAHTHCTRFTPDGKYLCIVDLGVDRIFFYPYAAGQGIAETPRVHVCDPADGPRHIIFDAAGTTAYVINELGNSVTAFRYADGALEKIATCTTLPEHCTAKTKAAAIRLSRDERFLYASNRGYDSIACFRVVKPGELELFDIVDAHGESPRDINFLPSGTVFTASNEFSDRICLFRFDAASGALAYMDGQDVLDEPRPLCIEY